MSCGAYLFLLRGLRNIMRFVETRMELTFRKWARHASLCSAAHGHVRRVTPIMVATVDWGRIARVITCLRVCTRLLFVDT